MASGAPLSHPALKLIRISVCALGKGDRLQSLKPVACACHGTMTDYLARVTPEAKLSAVTGWKDCANKPTLWAEMPRGEELENRTVEDRQVQAGREKRVTDPRITPVRRDLRSLVREPSVVDLAAMLATLAGKKPPHSGDGLLFNPASLAGPYRNMKTEKNPPALAPELC